MVGKDAQKNETFEVLLICCSVLLLWCSVLSLCCSVIQSLCCSTCIVANGGQGCSEKWAFRSVVNMLQCLVTRVQCVGTMLQCDTVTVLQYRRTNERMLRRMKPPRFCSYTAVCCYYVAVCCHYVAVCFEYWARILWRMKPSRCCSTLWRDQT